MTKILKVTPWTGEKLRMWRESIGWTQRQLADCIGVHQQNLALIEIGKHKMSRWVQIALDRVKASVEASSHE